MEYVEKTQRVRLGALHDTFKLDGMELVKEPTATNIADIFTKGLDRETFQKHRDRLTLIPATRQQATARAMLRGMKGGRQQSIAGSSSAAELLTWTTFK